jgi:hypothetical protein
MQNRWAPANSSERGFRFKNHKPMKSNRDLARGTPHTPFLLRRLVESEASGRFHEDSNNRWDENLIAFHNTQGNEAMDRLGFVSRNRRKKEKAAEDLRDKDLSAQFRSLDRVCARMNHRQRWD